MTIEEIYSYVKGYEYTREATEPYRSDIELFDYIYRLYTASLTAKMSLLAANSPKKFFDAELDLKQEVPPNAREEMFYSLRNGFTSTAVPAKAIYKIKLAYEKTRMPNLIFKCFRDSDLKIMFQKNYLAEGYNYVDVICTIINDRYRPLGPTQRKVDYGDWSEVYVRSTDMVAAIPNNIAGKLGNSDIANIELDSLGLHINKTYLRSLGGKYGASRSHYDLRECI